MNAVRLLAVFLLAHAVVPAQDFRGRITGRILDSSGGVIPGVRVKATNVETKAPVVVTSNDQGIYEVPYLTPGAYDLSAEREGFRQHVRTGLELRVGDTLSIDITLQPGAVVETVTVTAETPLLAASPNSGQVVDARRIAELPVSGHNPFVLAQLSSDIIYFGVPNHGSMAPSVEVFSNIGGSGVRAYNMEFSLDGAPSMWGSYASFSPPADMVSEFKVVINNFDAGAGHALGGTINVALRSGTNALHGTLRELYTSDRLMGLDMFQRRAIFDPSSGPPTEAKKRSVAPAQIWNLFSGTAGGPVKIPGVYDGKNRTFWIYGFDGHTKVTTTVGSYYRTVPTLAERQGDFSSLLKIGANYQIYDPATIAATPEGRFRREPFAGNVIPKSRISAMAQSFLPFWSEPNTAGTADGTQNWFRTMPEYSKYLAHMGRIDHNINEKHRFFARYHQGHQLFDSGQYFTNISTGSRRHRWSKGAGFDDVYVINPRFLVNFRYSLSRFTQQTVPLSAGFDLVGAGFSKELVSIVDPLGTKFPGITVTNYDSLSTVAPSKESVVYHTWAVDFTRIRGSHSIRFGGEFRCYRESNYNFTNTTPTFTFGNTWTLGPLDTSAASPKGQAMAAYLLDRPTGGTMQVNASYAQQSTYSAVFVQDDYKLGTRLTLNMGLRYEYESAVTERFNRSVRGFDFTTSSPIEAAAKKAYAAAPIPQVSADQFRALGGLQFAGAGGQPRSLWDPARSNIAPRIGIAYRASKTVVLRSGYGEFYSPMGVDRQDAIQTGFTQATSLVPSVDNGLHFIAGLANPFPDGIQAPAGAGGGLLTNVGRSVTFFEADRRPAYVQRWTVSLQKQLPRSILLEVGYAGTRGSRLYISREFNAVPSQYYSTQSYRDNAAITLLGTQVTSPFYPLLPGTDLAARTVARSQLLRPYPQFSSIAATEPFGSSWYHAGQLRVERRMRAGFTVQGNFTWSKFLEATTYLNAFDASPERVISDQDRARRFVGSGIWELPFGRGRYFAAGWTGLRGQIISGWQIQGIYQAQSGAPLAFGNVLLTGDLHAIPLPAGERAAGAWFNTAGLERDSAKQLSSNLRTFPSRLSGARGPGLNLWNFSMLRNFRITDRTSFQLRAELLNAFNHTHLAAPNTTPTSTLFGQITGSNGYPRYVYIAGKLRF
jgi:hypothetical protein